MLAFFAAGGLLPPSAASVLVLVRVAVRVKPCRNGCPLRACLCVVLGWAPAGACLWAPLSSQCASWFRFVDKRFAGASLAVLLLWWRRGWGCARLLGLGGFPPSLGCVLGWGRVVAHVKPCRNGFPLRSGLCVVCGGGRLRCAAPSDASLAPLALVFC